MRRRPPQCGQRRTSIANTRLISAAQESGPALDEGGLWGAGGEGAGADPLASSPSRPECGTTAARRWARGARTPWNRSR
jgi:hypothetical protein